MGAATAEVGRVEWGLGLLRLPRPPRAGGWWWVRIALLPSVAASAGTGGGLTLGPRPSVRAFWGLLQGLPGQPVIPKATVNLCCHRGAHPWGQAGTIVCHLLPLGRRPRDYELR